MIELRATQVYPALDPERSVAIAEDNIIRSIVSVGFVMGTTLSTMPTPPPGAQYVFTIDLCDLRVDDEDCTACEVAPAGCRLPLTEVKHHVALREVSPDVWSTDFPVWN